jgi:peptidoglycan glycosyltransferase
MRARPILIRTSNAAKIEQDRTMTAQLNRLALAFGAAFLAVALAGGYWGIVRAGELSARGDNPRRVLAERRTGRGVIFDRNGQVLADNGGAPGDYTRRYDYPELAPVIGYISPLFGAAGIEAALDDVLHGDAGLSATEIYWRTHVLGQPPPGRGVRLTIDLRVQRAADDALGPATGAVVAINAKTGEILAMASHPNYDANQLDTQWPNLVSAADAPLLNRATLALYQPGGALWPVVLAGAITDANLDPRQPYLADSPQIKIDGHVLACRLTPPSTMVTLGDALTDGCPGPVAAAAAALSSARLLDVFTAFRLYSPPTIVIPSTAETAVEVNPEAALAAVGQGSLRVTPLHVAQAMAALTTGGRLPAPQLVLATQDAAGEWRNQPPAESSRQAIPAPAAIAIRELLAGGYEASAITSTAGQTLAWYSAFGPAVDTEYVVTVLLESGDTAEARRIGEAVLAAVQATP